MSKSYLRTIVVDGEVAEVFSSWEDNVGLSDFMERVMCAARIENYFIIRPMASEPACVLGSGISAQQPQARIVWIAANRAMRIGGEIAFFAPSHKKTKIALSIDCNPESGLCGMMETLLLAHVDRQIDSYLKSFEVNAKTALTPITVALQAQ